MLKVAGKNKPSNVSEILSRRAEVAGSIRDQNIIADALTTIAIEYKSTLFTQAVPNSFLCVALTVSLDILDLKYPFT